MSKNTVLNNLPEDEILWADTKRILGMPISFTKYRVDENRLYCKRGFLKVETDELLLYRIMDIRSSQTLGQRIFGVGTVVLFCTDKTSGVLEAPPTPSTAPTAIPTATASPTAMRIEVKPWPRTPNALKRSIPRVP